MNQLEYLDINLKFYSFIDWSLIDMYHLYKGFYIILQLKIFFR